MGFIVIDGPNGAGKTTALSMLKKLGYYTFSSPHGTPLSSMLRDVCRGVGEWKELNSDVQLLLFAASRTDEYVRLVEPIINRKGTIIADRWWTSTYVYQVCHGGSSERLFQNTIYNNEKIERIILLDAKDDTLIERVRAEREANAKHLLCRWTSDVEAIKKVAGYYRERLYPYITKHRFIPCSVIDTTIKTSEEVVSEITSFINKEANNNILSYNYKF